MNIDQLPDELKEAAKRIELFLFDVDGVLTDASLYMHGDGSQMKAFNSRDGAWIKYLPRHGIQTGIITGRTSDVVALRARELNMKVVVQGAKRKRESLAQVVEDTGVDVRSMAYIGDDLVDLPVLTAVGLSFAPADAHPEVRSRVDYVTAVPGGRGVAQEAVEVVLRARGVYDALVDGYL